MLDARMDAAQIALATDRYNGYTKRMQRGSMLDDEDLRRRLDALGTSTPVSSKIARLRRLYDSIEGAMRRGASRQDVLNELNADGFGMTMPSFKSALQRMRAERKGMPKDALKDFATKRGRGVAAATTGEQRCEARPPATPMGEAFASRIPPRRDERS